MKYHLEFLLEKLKNKKVAFLGVARANLPLIKLLIKHQNSYNIKLLALDKSKTNKDEDLRYLAKQEVECRLGEDYLKKPDMDVIFRSPGVYYNSRELEEVKKHSDIEITSEVEEFFKIHPCKIIAITGSDGKTTTTTLISKILKENGYRVHLGGNIGIPLLHTLEDIKPEDFAVVELSSFQLISMQNSPDIAVLTNISPNHLDIHKNMNEYVSAKENILIHQKENSLAVLNKKTDEKYNLRNLCKGKVLFFSTNIKEFSSEINPFGSKAGDLPGGAIEIDGKIYFVNNNVKDFIVERGNIKLKGQHNTENILAAICATYNLVDKNAIISALVKFTGVQHRLEFVAEKNGVTYINDSIATTPTRTIKGALSVFNKKIILIAGGYDKNLSFDELGLEIINKVKLLILVGQTSEKIANSVKKATKDSNSSPGTAPRVVFVDSLESAVNAAKIGSEPGDVVVLSPACASFGLFKNFEERGNKFKELVSK